MPTEQKILDVIVPKQVQDNWCWAAVAVGIATAYGDKNVFQCDTAAHVLNTVCCPAGKHDACDKPHTLAEALNLKSHFQAQLNNANSRTFPFVKENIDKGHPIAVRIDWKEGKTGHFVVISGYRVIGNVPEIFVCDPFIGGRGIPVPIKQFTTNYQTLGSWDLTFQTIGTQPVPECNNAHPCA